METASHGGLIGAASRFFGSAKSTAHAGVGIFSKPEAWAVRLAALAGLVAIYVKSGAPTFGFEPVVFALAIGLSGLMFEASSAKNVMRSLWEGRAFGIAVWSTLWICAFSYSAFNWISVAAENEAEKTNIHKAAAFKSEDVRAGVKSAAEKVLAARAKAENLRKAAWETIPTVGGVQIQDVTQADALIEKAKGNTKLWEMTKACTETNGPKTRAFCAEYSDAKAARASAEKRSVIAEDYKSAEDAVKSAETEHIKARSLADNTRVETKEGRADLLILAGFFGISGDQTEQKVEQVAAIFKIMAVSVFLSLGAAMMELEKLRAAGPRRPFAFFGRAYRWFYRLLTGAEAPVQTVNLTNNRDPRVQDLLGALASMKAA